MTSELDPRIMRGTRRMLAVQRRQVEAGSGRLGWKAAFGSPAGMAALGIDRPLVGFLTRDRLLQPGATVSVQGWTRPLLEAEVAVHIGAPLGAAPERAAVRAAIAGLSVAIELADLDSPPTDVATILGNNIFHRHVMVGAQHPDRRDLRGLSAVITRDGAEVASTHEPEALTGRLVDVVASMADTLAHAGELLRPGDLVITGSVVPPLDVAPGDRLRVELTDLGSLEVTLC